MFLNISFLQFVIVEVTFFDTFLGCMSEPLHASVAAAINLLLYLIYLVDLLRTKQQKRVKQTHKTR